MSDKIATLLKAVNDLSSTIPYGDGWLVRTPLTYSDGDAVTVFVDPVNKGLRVTDRGEAIDRLSMWGVAGAATRARQGIVHVRHAHDLSPLGSTDEEMATFGNPADLGTMILDVAQASMRVEQLRWLALDHPTKKFEDRLSSRLESLASDHDWTIERRAGLPLPGDRTRQVTASVTGKRARAYVQAVGDSDRERAVANCYYIFDRALAPPRNQNSGLGRTARWMVRWDSRRSRPRGGCHVLR